MWLMSKKRIAMHTVPCFYQVFSCKVKMFKKFYTISIDKVTLFWKKIKLANKQTKNMCEENPWAVFKI